jgi:hypothetical protein
MDRLNSAIIAVILGGLVWLYARSRDQETLDNMPIPVQIQVAPGQAEHYDLEVTGPSQVLVSFSGTPSRMRELRHQIQAGELVVRLSLTVPEDRQQESRYLDTARVSSADIHVPPGVRAMVVEGQSRIPVTLRRLVERRLPVQLDYVHEDRLGRASIEPDTVLVRGPQDILDRVRTIPTQACTRAPPADNASLEAREAVTLVPLVRELDGRPVRTTPSSVTARLTFRPRQKMYDLVDVPVQFLCPANFTLRPKWEDDRSSKISLRLTGPAGMEPPQAVVYIDLSGRKFDPGFYADEVFRLQLPKDFQLAQPPPRSGAFRLIPLPPDRADERGLETGTRDPGRP